ncbi:lasso RiPP family leader peptide-containing protein [Pseudonocardia sp.]|nr:lasso RiPP family leader peptide-containing protein [Pseudonocardia sp.]
MKKEYTPPTVEDLGSLRELTLAGTDGDRLDMTFNAGTSRGDLTFS